MDTYLGRDAGRRVLAGHITRGVPEKINAVLWFSDLEGYTRISDASGPEQVIPLLNDYAEALVTAVHAQGGDVLKFIGDACSRCSATAISRRHAAARSPPRPTRATASPS